MSDNNVKPGQMISLYCKLFIVLVIITCLGIGVAFLHIPPLLAIIIALSIILIKSGIVYKAFKPFLIGNNSLIILFSLTVVFFIAVMLLPVLNSKNHITGTVDTSRLYDLEHRSSEEKNNGH